MKPERYARLRELYHAIAPLEGSARDAALRDVERERPSLARELGELLGAATEPVQDPFNATFDLCGELLAEIGRDVAPPAEGQLERVGPYALLRSVGHGAMGQVYEALQEKPRRRVALKLIHGWAASERRLQRFEDEIEMLGRIEHPNVARIYDSGVIETETGPLRYFAMEWIRGPTLGDWLANEAPLIAQRLGMFRRVCSGVVEAHARGIVHRDIKPSNILVDAGGQPKILDFGVSRLMAPELEEPAGHRTRDGELLGTLQYMSPEQLSGDPNAVDTRADVYSLGVVLFEMITGELPRDAESEKLLPAVDELRRARVRRLSDVRTDIDSDLSTIVAKALELEPDDRYGSVRELDEDVARYLANEPIRARPTSLARGLILLYRRRRALVAGLAAAALFLCAGLVIIVRFARDADIQREEALFQAYRSQIAGAYGALRAFDPLDARKLLDAADPRYRGWEWDHLHGKLDASRLVLRGHANQVWDVTFSPDGQRLITVGGAVMDSPQEQAVRAWDVSTGELLYERLLDTDELVVVAHHPEADVFATGGGSIDPTLRVWRSSTGALLQTVEGHADRIKGLVFDDDGERLFSVGFEGLLQCWRWDGAELAIDERLASDFRDAEGIAASEGRFFLLSSHWAEPLQEWSMDPPRLLRTHPYTGRTIAADPSGRIAVGADSGRIDVFDADGTNAVHFEQEVGVRALAFTADGETLFSSGFDGVIRMWNVAEERLVSRLMGHTSWVHKLTTRGETLASGSHDNTARLWDPAAASDVVLDGLYYARTIAPDARGAVALTDMGRVIVASGDGAEIEELVRHPSPVVHDVAVDGATGWIAYSDDSRILSRAEGGEPYLLGEHAARIHALDYHAEPGRLASAAKDGTFALWDPGAESPCLVHESWDGGELWDVEFDPSGERFVLAGLGGRLEIRGANGEHLANLVGHEDHVFQATWSPDGRWIASGGIEGELRIWEASTGACVQVLAEHDARITGLAFGSDDTRLFSCADDFTVRVWSLPEGIELLALRGLKLPPTCLAFEPITASLWVGMIDRVAVFHGPGP